MHIHVCTYVPTCIVLFTEVVYADVDQPIYANTDAIPKPKPVRQRILIKKKVLLFITNIGGNIA